MRNGAALLLALCAASPAAERFFFATSQASAVIAELDMRSPASDWAVKGREAAVASIRVDGAAPSHVFVFSGPEKATYRVLLGDLAPGEHEVVVDRDEQHSATGADLEIAAARFRETGVGDANYLVLKHAPVLFARRNTVGRFSDVPLLTYCERLEEAGRPVLQYTVVFSNEDGGTSTRALMARWGRTTDIEYIYRVYLDAAGAVVRTTVQGRDHQELDYNGARDAGRATLMPVTDNNMVAEASGVPLRFQLAPAVLSLEAASREQIMDDHPVTYLVMAKELEREGKLRPFGVQAGEKISDPRNYLFVEYRASHTNSALAVGVHLKSGRAFSSDLGRLDYAIGRDGWVRTTVELPPGTKAADIAAFELRCMVAAPGKEESLAHSGVCRVERVSKAFFLDPVTYAPSKPLWSTGDAVSLRSGESAVYRP